MLIFNKVVLFLFLPILPVVCFVIPAYLGSSASSSIAFVGIFLQKQQSFGCRHFKYSCLALFVQ